MKKLNCLLALVSAIAIGSPLCHAQSNAPVAAAAEVSATNPTAPSSGDEKRANAILKQLKLDDAAKEARVKTIIIEHAGAQKAWHQKNDAQISDLWNQFNQARSKTNQPQADLVMGQIDTVYAGFKPEHDAFLTKLGANLTPEQIESVKDTMTINKVKVTYNAYQQIFHGLTPAQNEFIFKNLKAAREEAMDAAGISKEGSAFFKKYKIKIEAYLTAQGYDVKQSYVEFVAKQKAEMAAKDAGKSSDTKDAAVKKEKE
jgi:Protein of unknown function (DUF3826)